MREILFRAKRIDTGEWVYGYLVKRPSTIQMPGYCGPWYIEVPPKTPEDDGGTYNVDPDTVGQYTGLDDIYGVKVFDGDIVATGSNCRRTPPKIVEREPGGWYWMLAPHRRPRILGNRWDNPELLKEVPEG